MSYCDFKECKRVDKWVKDSEVHIFSGYGWITYYHPECCPSEEDGDTCLICKKERIKNELSST